MTNPENPMDYKAHNSTYSTFTKAIGWGILGAIILFGSMLHFTKVF